MTEWRTNPHAQYLEELFASALKAQGERLDKLEKQPAALEEDIHSLHLALLALVERLDKLENAIREKTTAREAYVVGEAEYNDSVCASLRDLTWRVAKLEDRTPSFLGAAPTESETVAAQRNLDMTLAMAELSNRVKEIEDVFMPENPGGEFATSRAGRHVMRALMREAYERIKSVEQRMEAMERLVRIVAKSLSEHTSDES